MSVTEQLLSNILETRFENIPKDIVKRAKDEVIDVIGCAIGGANDTGCPMIVDLVREWGGSKESTILAYGIKAPSHNVALANAIMARSFDFGIVSAWVDGVHIPAHIGETLVPTAIAVAEQKALSGKELLTALIVGEDLVSRIMAAATGFGRGGGGVNTFGAAAIAGRLWGLDNRQLANAFAFGIAPEMSLGQVMSEGVHSFKLAQGLAAQHGIFSVRLASKGFTGVKDPLTGEGGYFALYCPDYNPEVLTKDLGQKFWTSITFKPYPCCRATHGAVNCSLEILRKYEVKAGDIDEVTVITSSGIRVPLVCEPFRIGVVPHVSAIFSIPYNVASVLVRGRTSPEYYSEECIRDPQIAEMVKKVKVTLSPFPNETFFATTVKVKLKDGREFSEHVNVPLGDDFHHPLTKEAKREKFRINASFTKKVNMDNAEKALGMLEKLEEVEDITKIVKLLIASRS